MILTLKSCNRQKKNDAKSYLNLNGWTDSFKMLDAIYIIGINKW